MYFAVQLDGNMNIGSGQILPFRTIKSNVGNGYDLNTFKFKPPHNGTYEFTLQINDQFIIFKQGRDQREWTGPM